ncbi:PEP-CTERM sorting domain-containing protein [Sphingopyxis sp.]|uniref:PEP-CTERM sorting domain-containing protein n=1 Tax=Sphingopyxis sp. TaxID=1908224 RepID=UPI0025F99C87|nr:PEP-CTERM sorting domain-containing protein [Sphingopyxis sp.]MBK6413655.1 PEP-CTERM sorting domain-containing protein [Sphingopyxis sp.]
MQTDNYQDTLAGGSFVYYNAGSDFAALTSNSWNKTGGGDDVFFKASFSAAAVPEPETWALMLIGLACGGAMRSAKRGRRSPFPTLDLRP